MFHVIKWHSMGMKLDRNHALHEHLCSGFVTSALGLCLFVSFFVCFLTVVFASKPTIFNFYY